MTCNLDCLVKVSDHAEPYFTKFSLDTGKIVDDIPWLSAVPVKDIYGIDRSTYSGHLNRDYYYDILFRYKNVRMAVNYRNEGVILVFDDRCVLCDDNFVIKTEPFMLSENFIKTDVVEVGCVLTPAFTFDVMHPASKLTLIQDSNSILTMTRFGLVNIGYQFPDIIQADDSVKVTPSRLLDEKPGLYAGYAVNGDVKYIQLKEVIKYGN